MQPSYFLVVSDGIFATTLTHGSVQTIPFNAVKAVKVFARIAEPQLDVDIAANEEINGTRLPAFGQGGPHRSQRTDVVLLIAATVRHIHGEQHRRAHHDGGAPLMISP